VSTIRGSDVFIKDDIRAILASLFLASELVSTAYGSNPDYRSGFTAALASVATALAITPHEIGLGGCAGEWHNKG